MLALTLSLALGAPPDLSGEWAPRCHRTPLGTGTCEAIVVTTYRGGEVVRVTSITRSKRSAWVADGRHVFREVEERLGPIPATLGQERLSWTTEKGVVRRLEVATDAKGMVLLRDGEREWHRDPPM